MWRTKGLAGLFLIGASLFLIGPQTARASCIAPYASVKPSHAGPGEPFTVSGQGFADGCNDVVGCEQGKPCPSLTPSPPTRHIPVDFVQGSRTWHLGTVDGYAFSKRFSVPRRAAVGKASVVVGGECAGEKCILAFRVGLPGTGSAPGGLSTIGIITTLLGISLVAASNRLQNARSTPKRSR